MKSYDYEKTDSRLFFAVLFINNPNLETAPGTTDQPQCIHGSHRRCVLSTSDAHNPKDGCPAAAAWQSLTHSSFLCVPAADWADLRWDEPRRQDGGGVENGNQNMETFHMFFAQVLPEKLCT